MFILENKTNKKYKINVFYSRDFQRKVYSLSLCLTEYYFYFQSSTLSDNTTILLDSLHATWHIVRCCRRCIRVMPEKFAKLFTTCVGGAHLRRKATRTPQVLRVIRVVHYRLRAHYSIKRSEYTTTYPVIAYPTVSDVVLQFTHGIIRVPFYKIVRYVASDNNNNSVLFLANQKLKSLSPKIIFISYFISLICLSDSLYISMFIILFFVRTTFKINF